MRFEIPRRSFLKQTAFSLLALKAIPARIRFTGLIDDGDVVSIQRHLLSMVNEERADAGLSKLKLDELACNVAQKHAIEMAENDFMSHWDLAGLKPYHRYSFAGGTDATGENDASADYSKPIESDEMPFAAVRMHITMHDEVPPNDGHRQTMLTPQHTHVGFGMAWRGLHIRLCEVYVSRYVSIDPYPTIKPPQSRFVLSGGLLDPRHSIEALDVYYEPPPKPPARSWLTTPRRYGMPQDRTTFYKKLPLQKTYDDGSTGSIEFPSRGRFSVPIELSHKQPGIYTLVVWISRSETEHPFPATQICVRAE
jgi:Cysteine-rich secretory protein family